MAVGLGDSEGVALELGVNEDDAVDELLGLPVWLAVGDSLAVDVADGVPLGDDVEDTDDEALSEGVLLGKTNDCVCVRVCEMDGVREGVRDDDGACKDVLVSDCVCERLLLCV